MSMRLCWRLIEFCGDQELHIGHQYIGPQNPIPIIQALYYFVSNIGHHVKGASFSCSWSHVWLWPREDRRGRSCSCLLFCCFACCVYAGRPCHRHIPFAASQQSLCSSRVSEAVVVTCGGASAGRGCGSCLFNAVLVGRGLVERLRFSPDDCRTLSAVNSFYWSVEL